MRFPILLRAYVRIALVSLPLAGVAACASGARALYMVDRAQLRCGIVLTPGDTISSERVSWRVPKADDDKLASLCGRVGPAVVAPAPALANAAPTDTLL